MCEFPLSHRIASIEKRSVFLSWLITEAISYLTYFSDKNTT